MNSTVIAKEKEIQIRRIFMDMTLEKAKESDSLALPWLEKHQKTFYGFLDGCWLNKEKIEKDVKSLMKCHKICDPFNGKNICDIYSHDDYLIEYAAENSATGFKAWTSISPMSRSKILYDVAQALENYQQLFAIIEALCTAKHLYKVKKDILNLIEGFNYYAGYASKLDSSWFPAGPVCVINEEYNNPSLILSLRVCSALASGNSVLLLTDVHSSLSSFLLAEICSESGIPPGVLNVIPIEQDNLEAMGISHIFSKFLFTGTFEKSISFSKLCSKAGLSCDFLIPRRPVVIVYENADLHSAANGVIEAFLYHDVRSASGGCKVMVQESIREEFLNILEERFCSIQIGDNFSKTDATCLVSEEQKKFLMPLIEDTTKHKGKVLSVAVDKKNYESLPPTLFANFPSNHKLVHEELGGPIGIIVHFRTVKESISMFNCDNKGFPVNIWTEKISVALEVAMKLKSGVVWINSENVIDVRTAFSGVYLSGNSAEGGQDP